ncbi:MAG: class I SAM-dependent methyltransferase [Patescibacteria group bacterium]
MERSNFDVLSKDYDAARRGYPEELFRFLKGIVTDKKSQILDVGCGTGISTRQLKHYGYKAIGSDKGVEMIQIAKNRADGISYIVAPASKLPFRKWQFDIITAFTAFHWFDDAKSVNEMKRVLKKGGIFIAVQKTLTKSKDPRVEKLQRGQRVIMNRYFGKKSDAAKNHDAAAVLGKSGFVRITRRPFYFQEKYTLAQAMLRIKSMSNWNLLSDTQKEKYYSDIYNLYKKNLIGRYVVRECVAKTVVGYLS